MPSLTDEASLEAIRLGRIIVKPYEGEIWRPTGQRAEHLDRRLGYGRVFVSSRPQRLAMAHRVIWIAEYGLIPDRLQVNHINARRWDNRLENLELVSPTGNVRHALGRDYDAVGARPDDIPTDWLGRLDSGEPLPEPHNPFARHPGAV